MEAGAKKNNCMASRAATVQAKQKSCSNCGEGFACGAGETSCWCFDLPHLGIVAAKDQDCLCPTCLREAISKMPVDEPAFENEAADAALSVKRDEVVSQPPLVEGEDYYLEGAAMVFTARFLLRRGYCCESGCRHCPFTRQGPGST
jgi:uncharacterized protein DUF5522/cysteine-rich CWC protein